MGREAAQLATPEAATIFLSNLGSTFTQGIPFTPNDPIVAGLREQFASNPPRDEKMAVTAYVAMLRNERFDQNDLVVPVYFQAAGYVGAAFAGARAGNRRAANDVIGAASIKIHETIADANTHLDRQRNSFEKLRDEAIQTLDRQINDHQIKADAVIERIDNTRDSYDEIMKLKAPMDFWEQKGKNHRQSVNVYRRWLSGITVALIILFTIVYAAGWYVLDSFTLKHPTAAIAMTIYIAGFVGAVTAIGLWFIRIIVRLYMSQQHFALDADERAALIRTYLALNKSKDIDEKERVLALAAIFRPVPDGIIKDDGAPSFSPASLLAGALDRKA